jgi:hypothetical protein
MSVCRNCKEKMIWAKFSLESNDNRMTGDYCSRKCITERRASMSPYHDLSYLRRNKKEEVKEESVIEKEIIKIDPFADLNKSEASMWKSLFG